MERVGTLRFLQAMSPVVGDAGAMQSLGSYIHGMSDYMARKYKQSSENMAEETATGAGVIGRDLPDALRP
jgi:ubiquinone biosynthesis protein UbiJ